jgi:tripartite-type tricarboxylate transporter receptor subunit TctC
MLSLPLTRRAAMLACASLATAGTRAADTFPNRPVRVVVPYAVGGTDAVTRQLAQRLTELSRETFFVENKPGADGTIGAAMVANAQPDGHTLLVASGIPLLLAPTVHKNLTYDATRDLVPVAVFSSVPMVVIASRGLGVSTMKDLVGHAKANPGTLSYGGAEQMVHLGMEMILRGTGTQMVYVPYKGAGPAMTDVLGGNIQLMLSSVAVALPHVKEGRVRALAVTSSARSAALPDVPTIAESVLPGYSLDAWFAVMAPAKTPPAAVEALSNFIGAAMKTPATQQKFESMGSNVLYIGHREARDFLARENARWSQAAKDVETRGATTAR